MYTSINLNNIFAFFFEFAVFNEAPAYLLAILFVLFGKSGSEVEN